jgi:hypothetical protein
METTRTLDRIRFVTQHFHDLQGLRHWVPLGLVTLGWGGPAPLRIASVLVALLMAVGAKRYYRNAFGVVEGQAADPASEVYPVSIFSPAGATPRLGDPPRRMPALARPFLLTVTLAMVLFAYFQAVPSNMLVLGDESLGQHPRIVSTSDSFYSTPWITQWSYPNGAAVRPPSMRRAVVAQAMYVLYGSLFLGICLWRKRDAFRGPHPALAVLLLGLASLGTSLAFVARKDGGLAPFLDFFLPALVYPGVALLICGASTVLMGLFDHWQLVHALGRPCKED